MLLWLLIEYINILNDSAKFNLKKLKLQKVTLFGIPPYHGGIPKTTRGNAIEQ